MSKPKELVIKGTPPKKANLQGDACIPIELVTKGLPPDEANLQGKTAGGEGSRSTLKAYLVMPLMT